MTRRDVIDSRQSDRPGARGLGRRVLVLAPISRDAALICRPLDEAGFDTAACPDLERLAEEIRRGAAAAVVYEEALSGAGQDRLASALAGQPTWSDFPLLVLVSRAPGLEERWRALNRMEGAAQLSLLERPFHNATLVSAVRAAEASRRRQYEVRDELTARRKAEHALRRHTAVIAGINRVLRGTLRVSTSARLAELCLTVAREVTQSRTGFLGEIDPTTGQMQTSTLSIPGRASPGPVGARAESGFPAGLGVPDSCARALLNGRSVMTNDPGSLGQRFHLPADHPSLQAFLAVPLARDQRIVGMIAVTNRPGGYGPEQLQTLEGLAPSIAEALGRKRAEEDLLALNETLEAQVAERTAVATRRARDLGRLTAELCQTEHRERKRLAKLLHDELQQLLLAARLHLPVAAESDSDGMKQQLDTLECLLGDCLQTSRNLGQQLSPPILQYGTLADVVRWLAQWFREKHGLSVTVASGDDPGEESEYFRLFLFQALRELLLNVTKHSGSNEARVELSREERNLLLQVEDGGDGFIPSSVEARLERADGFGLFHIRERLEAFQGRMEIGTTASGGACFRLIIPLAGPGVSPGAATPAARETDGSGSLRTLPGRPFRLLVVDDHAVVRESFISLLGRQPEFEVLGGAADGEEAIAQVDALRPDAIIMDVEMPLMDGVEATRRIKERYPGIVIIALSLHEETSVGRAMAQAGADAFISKHASAGELIEAVRRACAREASAPEAGG